MKVERCTSCNAKLESFYRIQYCPICKECATVSGEILREVFNKFDKYACELYKDYSDAFDELFWREYQKSAAVVRKITKEVSGQINCASKEMRRDVYTFLVACREIEKKYDCMQCH